MQRDELVALGRLISIPRRVRFPGAALASTNLLKWRNRQTPHAQNVVTLVVVKVRLLS
jgi:hypothetical protein